MIQKPRLQLLKETLVKLKRDKANFEDVFDVTDEKAIKHIAKFNDMITKVSTNITILSETTEVVTPTNTWEPDED